MLLVWNVGEDVETSCSGPGGGLCITQTISFSPRILENQGYSPPVCSGTLLAGRDRHCMDVPIFSPAIFGRGFHQRCPEKHIWLPPSPVFSLGELISIRATCNEAQTEIRGCLWIYQPGTGTGWVFPASRQQLLAEDFTKNAQSSTFDSLPLLFCLWGK